MCARACVHVHVLRIELEMTHRSCKCNFSELRDQLQLFFFSLASFPMAKPGQEFSSVCLSVSLSSNAKLCLQTLANWCALLSFPYPKPFARNLLKVETKAICSTPSLLLL